MINQNQKSKMKQDEEKGSVNPVIAAVTGAVLGAGVAVVGAVVLGNERNRQKAKEVLTNAKDQALGYMEDIQQQAQVKKGGIEEKLIEKRKKIAS